MPEALPGTGRGGDASDGAQRLAVGSVLAGSCPGIAGVTLAAACQHLPPGRKFQSCRVAMRRGRPRPWGTGETGAPFSAPPSWGFSARRAEQPPARDRAHGLTSGSLGSDFRAEFLDENKKGGVGKIKKPPSCPLRSPPGCRVLLPQCFESPSAPRQPRKASPSPPARRTPNTLEMLLAGLIPPPLPRVPGSAGDRLCSHPNPRRPPGRQPPPGDGAVRSSPRSRGQRELHGRLPSSRFI